jgi:hypothetical protein
MTAAQSEAPTPVEHVAQRAEQLEVKGVHLAVSQPHNVDVADRLDVDHPASLLARWALVGACGRPRRRTIPPHGAIRASP